MSQEIDARKHGAFFARFLTAIPGQLAGQDTNRMTILYFAVSALDLLGCLDEMVPDKAAIVEWIYAQQVHPDAASAGEQFWEHCGFRGGPFLGGAHDASGLGEGYCGSAYDQGHLAMTYTALQTLQMLGDDLSRVNKPAILRALAAQQQPDGCFRAVASGAEADMRFMYTAVAISALLGDFSAVDADRCVGFVAACQAVDGGIALVPEQESHGGSTYCAVAALALLGRLADVPRRAELVQWLCERQHAEGGFNGRVNKDPDTCYAFWVGASLAMLGGDDASALIDVDNAKHFIFRCETRYGGFSKYPDMVPDPLHAYYSLAFLAIVGHPGLKAYDCALSRSVRVA